jgi:hypothetical protein
MIFMAPHGRETVEKFRGLRARWDEPPGGTRPRGGVQTSAPHPSTAPALRQPGALVFKQLRVLLLDQLRQGLLHLSVGDAIRH